MFHDLFLLPEYFDGPETAFFYEDLARKYGHVPLQRAIAAGKLITRTIYCGPNRGKVLVWVK